MSESEGYPHPGTPREPSEPGVVCTACLAPNPPRTDYCQQCGAVMNALVTFSPFAQTLAEGYAYRRAVDGPPSTIILIGVWLLFVPWFALVPYVFSDRQMTNRASGDFGYTAEHLFAAFYIAVATAILYRTTANYIRKRRAQRLHPQP